MTNEIYAFIDANFTDVNKTRFLDVAQTAITINATPALWFSCAGGSILLILAVVTLIDKWGNSEHSQICVKPCIDVTPPAKRYSWLQFSSRVVVGAVLIGLVALDKHATTVSLDANYKYTGSMVWRLATENWM